MIKRLCLYLNFLFTYNLAQSQVLDSLHTDGWRNIQLGSPIELVKQFVTPFSESGLKNLLHVTPSENSWFVYNDVPYSCKVPASVIINQVLIAVSEDNTVKRIKFYIDDSDNGLELALRKYFGEPLTNNSYLENTSYNYHCLWNTSNGLVLYLLRMRDSFILPPGSNTEMTFSFLKDANEIGKYIVRRRFDTF